ncbi:MAG: tetratricopeptide repeat protein, partial [Ardenticatenia bacterium]|nr:tetratricopeptide repeat protein [Ardenticatenia bacterium]
LTLNPVRHVHWLGLLAFIFLGIGWAKPVRIRPGTFKHRHWNSFLVSIAGVAANALLAGLVLAGMVAVSMVASIVARMVGADYTQVWDVLFFEEGDPWGWRVVLAALTSYVLDANVSLALFNLLPIPPLDGFQALRNLWGLIRRRRPSDERLAAEQVLVQLEAGVQAVRGDKLAEAVIAFRKALELKPDLYGAWHNLGLIYQDKGPRYAAIAAWQGALKAAADDEETRAEVQGRLASLGWEEEPEASYTTLLRQLPDIAPKRLPGDLGTVPTGTTIRRGRFKKIALWGGLAAVVGLVSFGLLVGLVVKAVGPDEYGVLVEQGLSLMDMEQLEEAEQAFQEARLRDTTRVEAHLGLGMISLAKEDCAAAVLHFQDATAAEPKVATGSTFLGLAHFCQWELDEALEALNRAKELGDQSVEVYWMLGRVHLQKYDLAAAESAFRQALKLAPDDSGNHSYLAFTLYHLGDLEEALSEANAALTLNSDSALAYETLALVHYDQGDVEAALTAAHRAVELEPQMVPALYVIGACFRDLGQVSQAAEYFRLAIERAGPMRFQQLYASRAQEELSALEP